ncbi:MAG: hypothetical protein HYR85_20095 [Planctomycetes bacterium]|nr:hypothetical protein [Planctomycetota bacterium]MBI3846792.1 hypothetical protein [Planctomycetota bacterium]
MRAAGTGPRACPLCAAPFPEGRATCPSCHTDAALAFTAKPEVAKAAAAQGRRAVWIASLVYVVALSVAWWLGR